MQEFKGNWGGRWVYDSSKQLGQTGGFARVFVGQSSEGVAVAVKVISRALPGGQVIDAKLLHRELDIAEKLRHQTHKHLINLLDVAELKESYLIVMELAEHSLADIIDKGVYEADAREILRHIAAGLHELHQAAIIHRDLKPANILLREGKWKLSDFGIARDAELGTGNPTFLGWGTCAYMAPELWENRSPTFKSDLYALGCVAVELLTGKTPFLGPGPEDFRIQHLQNQPAKPSNANPALADLILRLLNKDPAIRPQDSRAVKERLERIALPLSADQQRIQRLAAEHAEERIRETAAKAAKRAQDEQFAAWRRQGSADLEEICSDALVGLQTALPEVSRIETNSAMFSFECSDAALDFYIWNRWIFSPPDDVMPCAGDISARSRRSNRPCVLANIVYEQVDGRFIWRLYTFLANPLNRSYPYGPLDQDHGFKPEIFMKQRPYMLMNALHIWTVKKIPLTSEAIVELFGRALEFR